MSMGQPATSQVPWDQPVTSPEETLPPKKKGLSCGCMVLIFLGILFVLVALVCCGGVIWAAYYFRNAVSEDPKVIAEVAGRIAQLDIPEGLKPGASFNITNPFNGEPVMVWVVYIDEGTQSMLVLGSLGGPFAGQNEDEVWKEIQNSLRQQGLQQEHNVRHWQRHEKEIVVRGQPIPFFFATGQDEDSQAQLIEVTGTFQGKEGPAMFLFIGDAEKYDETTIVKVIESIR